MSVYRCSDKQLRKKKNLSDHVQNNEKKIVITVQQRVQGDLAWEPIISSEEWNHLSLYYHRRQGELKKQEDKSCGVAKRINK